MLNQYDASTQKLLQWLIISLLFPLVFLNGWLLLKALQYSQPLVSIFLLAALLALILNYPVQFLRERGIRRKYAVLLIFLLTVLTVGALAVTLIPVLLEDVSEIAQLLPQWFESGNEQLQAFNSWATNHRLPVSVSRVTTQIANGLPDQIQSLADEALSVVLGTVGNLSQALLTAVLTFYFLADGERLTDEIVRKIPFRSAPRIKHLLKENFQNYFIGQAALASLVGSSLTVAFLMLQLPYALLFGLVAGVMAVIPFGDTLTYGVISVLLASQDFWLGVKVLAIALVIDQVIDQLVAPRLLGSFTGLRPIWVIIALLVGTKVSGILGLIVAVPIASFIKSILVNGLEPSATSSANGVNQLTISLQGGELEDEPSDLLAT